MEVEIGREEERRGKGRNLDGRPRYDAIREGEHQRIRGVNEIGEGAEAAAVRRIKHPSLRLRRGWKVGGL